MPVTTFLAVQNEERLYPYNLSDSELADLLRELRSRTCEDWLIREQIIERRPWFRKPQKITYFQLYKGLDTGEYQQILFRHDEPFMFGVHTGVGAGYITAYILGMLTILDAWRRTDATSQS